MTEPGAGADHRAAFREACRSAPVRARSARRTGSATPAGALSDIVQVSVRLPADAVQALRSVAEREDLSLSALLANMVLRALREAQGATLGGDL